MRQFSEREIGKKLNQPGWESHRFVIPKYVGEHIAIGNDQEGMEVCMFLNELWQLYQEPQETVLMSPTLFTDFFKQIHLGTFQCERNARLTDGPLKVVLKNARWDCIDNCGTDLNGAYKFIEGQVSGELWIEVKK